MNERYFFGDNVYHKFNRNEILSILEKECKFFENVLDDIKPDYVLIGMPFFHYDMLLYRICKSKKIPVFLLQSTKFTNQYTITDETDKIIEIEKNLRNNDITLDELKNFFYLDLI